MAINANTPISPTERPGGHDVLKEGQYPMTSHSSFVRTLISWYIATHWLELNKLTT